MSPKSRLVGIDTDMVIELAAVTMLITGVDVLSNVENILMTAAVIDLEFIFEAVHAVQVMTGPISAGAPGACAEVNPSSL